MRQMRFWILLLAAVGCGGGDDTLADAGAQPDSAVEHDAAVGTDAAQVEIVQYEEMFDAESNTTYYLTRVAHEDGRGELVRLRHAHAIEQEGESVPAFAARMGNPALAINGSMGLDGLPPDTRQPVGKQIIDGEIVQDLSTIRYTLGIKEDNELVAYPPETTPEEMLNDGAVNALTAFSPLIVDHEPVSEDVLGSVANYTVAHPRQVIAQLDDLDLLILSCGGRGFGGDGMTALDVIRILEGEGVKFAFMLDGGGSVATVIHGERITEQIDGDGTMDRLRPNFLYVE